MADSFTLPFGPSARLLAYCLLFACSTQDVFSQVRSVVMVDDSPTAELLLQRASEQAVDNPEEAARLCAEVIDEYGTRLVPDTNDPTLFVMARATAEGLLLRMPDVLERFVQNREPLAARLLAEGREGDAVRMAWVTPSGGEAALRLAQIDLETLQLSKAQRELDRLGLHPSLDQRGRRHRVLMIGMISRLAGDEDSAREYESQLEIMGGAGRLLDHLKATSALSSTKKDSVSDAFESTSTLSSSGAWHRIWKVDVEETPFGLQRASSSSAISNQDALLDSAKGVGSLLILNPLVMGNAVFVDDGTSIRRYDRYGARLVWSHQSSPPVSRNMGAYVELADMDSDGQILVALSGLGMSTRRTTSPSVIGLDALDGSLLWSTRIDQCDFSQTPSSEGRTFNLLNAFPYSGPLIDGDRVIIPVRRVVAASRESIDYLVALHLDSGLPAWIRLLGSSGSLQVSRGFSRTILFDGNAITASPLGTISCTDATSGAPRWVRTFEVEAERTGVVAQPWEMSQPVVMDGAIIALSPNTREVVSIDIDTGAILETWPSGVGTRFGDVRYLLRGEDEAGESRLLAVGEDIHCLSLADGATLRWRFSDSARDENASREGITDRTGIRGRVQIAERSILVPGVSDLFVLDINDGKVRDIIDTGEPSNPISVGSEIILGESESVSSLMQLEPARLLLRDQIRNDPGAASRVVALAELGIQSANTDLVLEAASLFAKGFMDKRFADVRQTMIDLILDHESTWPVPSDITATDLLDAAESISTEENQIASVLYARGLREFRESRFSSALDFWEVLLGDPMLSRQMISDGTLDVSAARLAASKIRSSPDTLMSWNERCARTLRTLQESGSNIDMNQVRSLLGSDVSIDILWEMQNQFDDGDGLSRNQVLSRIASLDPGGQALGRVVSELRRIGHDGDADRINLMMVQNDDSSSDLGSDSMPQEVEAIRAFPKIGTTPGVGLVFDGVPVPCPESSDLCLVMDEDVLRSIGIISQSQESWGVPLAGGPSPRVVNQFSTGPLSAEPSLRVVKQFEQSFILACLSEFEKPAFRLLSTMNGEEIRVSEDLEFFIPDSESGRPPRAMMPNNRLFDPSQILLSTTSSSTVALMSRSGVVVGVSLDGADSAGFTDVAWRHEDLFSRLYFHCSTDGLLALYGVDEITLSNGDIEERLLVKVLELETGSIVSEFRPMGRKSIAWIDMTPVGTLILGSYEGLQCWEPLPEPELLWHATTESFASMSHSDIFQVRYIGNSIVIPRSGSEVSVLDFFTGKSDSRSFQFTDLARSTGATFRAMETTDRSLLVMTDKQVMQWDARGQLIGCDRMFDRESLLFMFQADGIVIVGERVGRSFDDDFQSILYRFHFLDPNNGLKIIDEPIEFSAPISPNHDLRSARVVDDWLVLELRGQRNLAIPLPSREVLTVE